MRRGRLSAALRTCLFLAAAAVCGVAILVALTNRPGDLALYPPAPGARTETVYVAAEGIHADLILPRNALGRTSRVAAQAVQGLGPGEWIAVGWGDERFYKETGLSPARALDALRCLFWPGNTRTVVRVDALAAPPPQGLVHASWVRLVLSEEGFRRLAARLDRAFSAPGGTPQLTPRAPWDATGRYFRSSERFHLGHLCTHWIADLLDAAGVPTATAFDTVPTGLIFDLGRHMAKGLDPGQGGQTERA